MTLQEELQRWAVLRDQAAQIIREEAEEKARRHEREAARLRALALK